jgi:uncharacterized protein YoxC
MSVFQNDQTIHNATYKQSRELNDAEKPIVEKLKKDIEALEKPTRDSLDKLLTTISGNRLKQKKLQTELDNINKETTELVKKHDKTFDDFENKTKPISTELQKYGITIEKFHV